MKRKLIKLTYLIAVSSSAFAQNNTFDDTKDCIKEIRKKMDLTQSELIDVKKKKCEMTLFLNKKGLVNGISNVQGEPKVCYRMIMKSTQVKCNELKSEPKYIVSINY